MDLVLQVFDNHITLKLKLRVVARLLKARIMKPAETAVARRWLSNDHAVTPTDKNVTME
jgi:hypothetical protein